jgi:hypothetical protein
MGNRKDCQICHYPLRTGTRADAHQICLVRRGTRYRCPACNSQVYQVGERHYLLNGARHELTRGIYPNQHHWLTPDPQEVYQCDTWAKRMGKIWVKGVTSPKFLIPKDTEGWHFSEGPVFAGPTTRLTHQEIHVLSAKIRDGMLIRFGLSFPTSASFVLEEVIGSMRRLPPLWNGLEIPMTSNLHKEGTDGK